MRVAMFALVLGSLLGTTAVTASAQVTGGPVVRGRSGESPRDDNRRDGSWDWRRGDNGRDNGRYDNRRDDRYGNGRYDDRRDRDWDRNSRQRQKELEKRYDRCTRDMWRNSSERRDDRWNRWDRRDRMQNERERDRIARICEREVYGSYGNRRW